MHVCHAMATGCSSTMLNRSMDYNESFNQESPANKGVTLGVSAIVSGRITQLLDQRLIGNHATVPLMILHTSFRSRQCAHYTDLRHNLPGSRM